MKRFAILFSLVVGLSTAAMAGPIPLPLPGPIITAGESILQNDAGEMIHVDWIVMSGAPFDRPDDFLYLFQLENDSSTNIVAFSVAFTTNNDPSGGQYTPGNDLDDALSIGPSGAHPGHNSADATVGAFLQPNELFEPTNNATTVLTVQSLGFADSIQWTFSGPGVTGLLPGTESDGIFRFFSTRAPGYVTGLAQGGSQFNSGNGQPIPGPPVSEPGTLLIMGLGFASLGLGGYWRRRKN